MKVNHKYGLAGFGVFLVVISWSLGAANDCLKDLHHDCHNGQHSAQVHDRRAYSCDPSHHDEPTEMERHLGKRALSHWLRAAKEDKNILVDQIIVGHALDGLKKGEVLQKLGKPRGTSGPMQILSGLMRHQDELLIYDVTAWNENSGSLLVTLENGVVKDASLRMSHINETRKASAY